MQKGEIMKIEAIAVDIDGTITDMKRRLCNSAMVAIRKAESIGVPTIIVTGNLVTFGYAASTLIGSTGGVVCENGGVIFKEGLYNNRAKSLTGKEYVNKAHEHLINNLGSKIEKIGSEDNEMRETEMVYYKFIEKDTIIDALQDFEDLDKIEIYDSGFVLHLTDKRVNKGTSLEVLCKETGIQIENVMAIGDSENDIDFLKVAGLKVSVANADDALKENSDYVCKKQFGDGVKEAIEKFVIGDE
jgi:sucrose-phosphate phosphatase-like hydrolase, Archaeal